MNLYCITCKCPLRDTETTAGRCWSCVEIKMYGELEEESSKQQRPVDPVEGGMTDESERCPSCGNELCGDCTAITAGATIDFIAGEGCVCFVRSEKADEVVLELSDETKARLAHLEAIEAVQREYDDLVHGRSKGSTGEAFSLMDKKSDLIRKGMKDNE